jgi:hypothetical protein
MAWALWMDEGPNPREKRGTGGAAGMNNTIRIKKWAAGGLVGETAGDALIPTIDLTCWGRS